VTTSLSIGRKLCIASVAASLLVGQAFSIVPAPHFWPSASDSPIFLEVRVFCEDTSAEIHYTTNGAEPTLSDPLIFSGASLTVASNCKLKAKAWSNDEVSTVTTEEYRVTGAVDSGYQHALAMSTTGRLWAWGNQGSGRLGNGLTAAANVMTPGLVLHGVGTFGNALEIAAGVDHSLVLDQDGIVWSFGENAQGQLGTATTTDSALPVQVLSDRGTVELLGACVSVAAGDRYSMALTAEGEPVTWGLESTGRLGNGANSSGGQNVAAPVERGDDPANPTLGGIWQISAGFSHGLAREPHSLEQQGGIGRVWAWGHNHVGQLGRGDISGTTRAYPMCLSEGVALTDAWCVSGGGSHTAVVRWNMSDPDLYGTVWSCGSQSDGRLGNGLTSSGNVVFPVQALKAPETPLTGVVQVSAGSVHTLALDGEGHVWSWGNNTYGQLGDGGTTHNGYAKMVRNAAGTDVLEDIVFVSAGGEGTQGTSLAVAIDGTIWVWGRNDEGQLGTGSASAVAALPVAHTQNRVKGDGNPALGFAVSVVKAVNEGEVQFTATPSHNGPNGVSDITTVEIFLNGVLVRTLVEAPWTYNISGLPAGSYHCYAVARDMNGLEVMSSPATFRILPDPSSDDDGDGITNGTEEILGINPRLADTDGDGMEDGWEHYYNLPADQNSATLPSLTGTHDDFDGDSLDNLREHDEGSMPAGDDSTSLSETGNNIWNVAWFGREGFLYFVKHSEDSASWQIVGDIRVGANSEATTSVSLDDLGAPSASEVRLVAYRYVDLWDWDGDGIPNEFETEVVGSDPLDFDSAGGDSNVNGISDGWELYYYGHQSTSNGYIEGAAAVSPDREIFLPQSVFGYPPP
jgi:alpha-tubulin suppressor-like RCC1 family protein